MATIFSPPTDIGPPPDFEDYLVDGRYNMEHADALDAAWIERLADWCRDNSRSDIAGEVIHFGVADGAARYMVWMTKPLRLIHLPLGDAYMIPEAHARGLRTSDVRQMVKQEKALNKLFGRPQDSLV